MTIAILSLLFAAAAAITTAPRTNIAIVGGGTSGCQVAAQLCRALPNTDIVLLERALPRSDEAEFLVRAPRNAFDAWDSDELVDEIETEEDEGLDDRRSEALDAATLGGGSAINPNQFVPPVGGRFGIGRVPRRGRDGTIRAYYRPPDVIPTGTIQKIAGQVLSTLGVSPPRRQESQIYADEYVDAGNEAGFVGSKDLLEGDPNSVFENRVAVENGNRVDSCEAFLMDALDDCDRLKFIQGATVTKLIFNKRKRATHVRYVDAKNKYNKTEIDLPINEVILTAGPYQSPRLLQVSGVGPWKVLKAAGIKGIADVPVGMNIQGRVMVPFKSSYDEVIEPANDPAQLDRAARHQWEDSGTGVFAKSVYAINALLKGSYIIGSFIGTVPEDVGQKILTSFCLPNPKSFGKLVVKNKSGALSVKLNLLGDKSEIPPIVRCLKEVERIHNQFEERFNLTTILPKDGVIDEHFIRRNAMFSNHLVGGCARGKVVNRKYQVRRVKGVRVVDSSVLSSIPQSAGPFSGSYVVSGVAGNELVQEFRLRDRRNWRW